METKSFCKYWSTSRPGSLKAANTILSSLADKAKLQYTNKEKFCLLLSGVWSWKSHACLHTSFDLSQTHCKTSAGPVALPAQHSHNISRIYLIPAALNWKAIFPLQKMDEIAVWDTENSTKIEERRHGLTITAATNSLKQGWRNSLKDIPHPSGMTRTPG